MQTLTPEERQFGLTTGESGQNVDPSSDQYHAQESPGTKKKSMMGKVKDKAKKLKTKIKNKTSSGNGDTSSSSGEEESDQSPLTPEPHGLKTDSPSPFGNKGIAGQTDSPSPFGNKARGVEDEKYQSTPGTDSLQDRLGAMNLEPQPRTKTQDELPTAAGQPAAGSSGLTHYLAATPPVEEGRDSQGRDLVADQSESKSHHAVPGIVGAAGTLGVGAAAAEHESTEGVEKKSVVQQAREKIFGSGKNPPSDLSQSNTSEGAPTIASKAAGTVYGLKDTVASKLGYGSSSPTPEGEAAEVERSLSHDSKPDGTSPSPKSYVQQIQETAVSGKDAVLGKLGYGEANPAAPGEVGTDQQKSYLQKAQESAYGAKDAVASKLGYNSEQNQARDLGQDVAPTRFHPGVEDKALSQIITDAMSSSATSVKNIVLSPFSPKPTTTTGDGTPASSAPSDNAAT